MNVPSFQKIMPVLRVSDMQRSVDWYRRTLGFMLTWRSPNDGGGENCLLAGGDTNLMLTTGSHLGDKPAFAGSLYFEMRGVRDFWNRIKDQADVVWPLEATAYCTLEFGIHDPDRYILAFAEPVKDQ